MQRNLLNKTYVVVLLLSLSFSTYSADDMDNVKLAEGLNQTWDDSFNQSDAKAVASLYGENAVVSPGNGTTLKGQEAIQNLFQSFFDNGVHSHKIDVIQVFRNGNTLYQVSNWQASGKAKDGVTPTFGGVLTLVSEMNESGEWKLHVHTWNMKQ